MSVSVWVLGVCVFECVDVKVNTMYVGVRTGLLNNQAILLYNRTILVFIICITYVHMYVYIRTYTYILHT